MEICRVCFLREVSEWDPILFINTHALVGDTKHSLTNGAQYYTDKQVTVTWQDRLQYTNKDREEEDYKGVTLNINRTFLYKKTPLGPFSVSSNSNKKYSFATTVRMILTSSCQQVARVMKQTRN